MTLRKAVRATLFCAAALAIPVSTVVFADTADSIRQYEKDTRGFSTPSITMRAVDPPVFARAAWQNFQKRHEGWAATWDMATGTPIRSAGPAIPLVTHPTTSAQAADLARNFLNAEASAWVKPDELTLLRASQDRNGWWVQYTQTYKGVRVVGARAFARISASGSVPLFGVQLQPHIDIETTPLLDETAARSAALADFPPETRSDISAVERVILPVSQHGAPAYRSAYLVTFKTQNPFGSWEAYVDARTGALLWRRSLLESIDITGSVSGGIEPLTQGSTVDVRVLPHVTVSLSDTGLVDEAVTDLNGTFLLSSPAGGPHTLTTGLSGPFAHVINASFPIQPLGFPIDPDSTTEFPITFDNSNSLIENRDAFYWAMRTHDFVRVLDPGFLFLDYPMYLITDYPDQQCNAFWDGYGVVFFAQGGVCANMARIASVVVHEYGHGITDFQYRPFSPSDAMHEGFSDYTSATLLNDPRIGVGFFGPGSVLRTVDNTRRYPEDVTQDPHATGLIIAGALWDVRKVLGAQTTDYLWHFARNGLSNNFDDYFFDFLVTDDDDGNVYNGTPHFDAIVNAFRGHGIGDYSIHVSHVPLRDTENSSASFPITASFLSIYAIDDASVLVHLAIDHGSGPVEETRPLLPTTGVREYTTVLEPQPNETIVSYWFTAQDTAGTAVVYPPAGAQNPFHFRIGVDETPPVIVHAPLRDQPLDAARMALEARVTDNLNKEIDTVRVIHARDNDPAETTILSPAGHDLYKGSMTFPGLELGQTIRYRIQVADSAIVPNVATSPDTGWHAFHIVRGFGRDFEANDGGLHAEELWEWGSPEPLLHAYSGVDVWGTNLSGAYPNDSDASLIIGPVDLSNFTTAGLYFRNFYDTEPFYDSGAVYASVDSGKTWQPLAPDGEYPFAQVNATGRGGYSGQSGDWLKAAFPLDAYAGVSNLLLKFEFQSDEAVGGLGWYVDDLEVVERQVLSRPLALIAVSGEDSEVPLTWTTPEGITPPGGQSHLLGYQVYRGVSGAEPTRITTAPLQDAHYLDTNLVNGTVYTYSVSAVYADGESEPSTVVNAMPYVATFAGSTDTLRVASMVAVEADTTLHIQNTGTGFLKVNLWPTEPGETLQNARIRYRIHTSSGFSRVAPGALKTTVRSIFPTGDWQLVYQDPQDHADPNIPDIDSVKVQVAYDSIYIRVTGHRPWGDPNTAWTFHIAFDTDLDPGTHPLGEYAILAGAAAEANAGVPAVLLNSGGAFAGPVEVAFPSSNVMQFGVFLGSIEDPDEVFLTLSAANQPGDTVLDTAPNAHKLPWLGADERRLVLSQGASADVPLTFFSLSQGDYSGQILIETNDPHQGLLVLPVNYAVGTVVPVDLLAFKGEANDLGNRLEWRTANETDLLGFRVLRREDPKGADIVLTPAPLTGDHGVYTFDDHEVVDGHDYWYRVQSIDRTGTVESHGSPILVHYTGVSGLTNILLRPSSPNPTHNATSIRFGLPLDANVTLRVFSIDGRLVRVLADGARYPRGFHELTWDGRDATGHVVSAGVFPYQLDASGAVRRGKITVLR